MAQICHGRFSSSSQALSALRRIVAGGLLLLSIGVASDVAEAQEKSGVGITVAPGGVRRYTPGEWSSVSVDATNKGSAETTAKIVAYFAKEQGEQFAREMWVPPKARRTSWMPLRAPKEVDQQRWSFDMTVMKLSGADGSEMIERREGEEMLPITPLLADKEIVKTASIFRSSPPDGRGVVADLDMDAYELMASARQLADLSRVIIDFPDRFAPPHPIMWETLDQFILCGDRIVEDSAGLATLRDWLFRGGRLCIFLDRTSPETVSAILGHGHTMHVVDRVELTDFVIEDMLQPDGQRLYDERRFEEPVELVRVVANDIEVQCQVNGWPAAFWKKAGNGEVLFITLGPRGWQPAQIPPEGNSAKEFTETPFRHENTLRALAMRFYLPRGKEPTLTAGAKPLLEEKIGYRIPKRSLATGLLGLNALALVASGLWLARRRQLERIAWVLPVVAGLTTAAFLVIGANNSRSVPSSVAYAQLVQFVPEHDTAHVSGLAAVYQQTTTDLQLSAGEHGMVRPLTSPADGTTQRLVWTDNDEGRWMNVTVPAGSVQFAKFDQRVQLASPVIATGQFTSRGFEGKLPMAAEADAEDALIASLPASSLAIDLAADGTFQGRPENVLAENQFLANALVTEESRRRQDVYRELLRTDSESGFARQPTLLTWMQPRSQTLSVPDDLQQQGTSLAAIPLWITPTPPQSEFLVPATFIRTKSVTGATGRSLAYNERRGAWIEDASRATTTRLHFTLPKEVRPCTVTEARITIKLNAPSRSLQVSGVVNQKDELIREFANPNGVLEMTVNRPEWLQVDDEGGLKFTFAISEAEQERTRREKGEKRQQEGLPFQQGGEQALVGSFETWRIDYVRVDVRGKTL